MYLRGAFKNILQHRGFLQLLSSWPTDNAIRTLVSAAAGLFAHPAAVLRHVAYLQDSQFRERLRSILNALFDAGKQVSISPFSQLDTLYVHIMKQIPESILLSAQFLLFSNLVDASADIRWDVAIGCCVLRISECTFKDIYHHLHAVIFYEAAYDPLSSLDPYIDLARPWYDQGEWFHLDQSIKDHVYDVHWNTPLLPQIFLRFPS